MANIDYKRFEGNGAPLIFVHGWLGSRHSFDFVRKRLRIENPHIVYDQRCHGERDCSPFSMEDLARDLGEIVEDIDQEPIPVGHSLGGFTVLQYLADSDFNGKAVLLGTCASTPEPVNEDPQYFMDNLDRMPREQWAEKIVSNYTSENTPEKIKQMAVTEMIDSDREPLEYPLRAMIGYDVREKLGSHDAIVVAGTDDGAITMDKSRELADLLNCPLEKIKSSHLMLQEKPDKITALIEDFLEPEKHTS